MKLTILLALLSFSAFASEHPSDPCPGLERREQNIKHEIGLLRIEARQLSEHGQFPQDYDELGCEDVMDDATYVDRRIKNLQKLLKEVKEAKANHCFSENKIP